MRRSRSAWLFVLCQYWHNDNNDAERPLRPAKLHDKISGTFRAETHAEAFATIRSYLQTAAKHDRSLLGVLTDLFTSGAWLPPDPTPG